jgi:hypothetical protein
VYNRKVKLYTLLYDLLDQLSLEAGTRKEEPAGTTTLVVGSVVGIYGQTGQSQGTSRVQTGGTKPGVQRGKEFTKVGESQYPVYQGKKFAMKSSTEEWDFESSRKYVKKLLQVPNIVQFSGTAHSDPSTSSYAKLSLSWKAEHPVGISEYSFYIPNYSTPLQVTGGGSWGMGYLIPPMPWRSVATTQSMVIPFIKGAHASGTYDVWIRARGAGGYTLAQRGTVNVDYTGLGPAELGGAPTKTSTLNITDNTPPLTPIVNDGGDTTSSTTLLYATWSAADYESGIQEYQYQVGYIKGSFIMTPGGISSAGVFVAMTPWLSAGGQTEMNIRLDTPMEPGVKYYIRVKAKNGVGLWSPEGASNGIQLKDPTPPTKPVIVSVSLADNTLKATWSSAQDPETGVMGYQVALGTSAGAADVIKWTNIQATKGTRGESLLLDKTTLSQMLPAAGLRKGGVYYFSIKAMNGIGVIGSADSKAVAAK